MGRAGCELAAQFRRRRHQFAKCGGVRTVKAQVAELLGVLLVAVDAQCFRHARPLVQLGQRGGVIHAVLGHLPVGRPLSAGDREQPGLRHLDRVLAGKCGRAGRFRRLHQRPDAGEDAEDVGPRRIAGRGSAPRSPG